MSLGVYSNQCLFRCAGVFSGPVPGAHLVFPRKVSGGAHDQIHDLEHHHDRHGHGHRRARRLALDPDIWLMDTQEEPGKLLPKLGETMSINFENTSNRQINIQ